MYLPVERFSPNNCLRRICRPSPCGISDIKNAIIGTESVPRMGKESAFVKKRRGRIKIRIMEAQNVIQFVLLIISVWDIILKCASFLKWNL